MRSGARTRLARKYGAELGGAISVDRGMRRREFHNKRTGLAAKDWGEFAASSRK